MTTVAGIRVLIADGQRLFADALARALGGFGFDVVGETQTSGLSVLRAAIRDKPDVVILDYWLPDMHAPAANLAGSNSEVIRPR